MPVHCPLTIPRLTGDQFAALDYDVMGLAFNLHNDIGCKWNEATYQTELALRLEKSKLAVYRELPVIVTFGQFSKTYYVDLVVSSTGIYELKTVKAIDDAHIGQVLHYLRLLDATRGKIINFRPLSVESKFVNCNDTLEQRRTFEIDSGEYRGPRELRDNSVAMLRDLGTKLSVSLYNQCLLDNVGRLMSLTSSPCRSSSQSFQIVDESEAFSVTAIENRTCHHREHLRRMVARTSFKLFHWINVTPKVMRLETIENPSHSNPSSGFQRMG